MPRARQTLTEINRVVTHMVEASLANDQNFSFLRELGANRTEVTFNGAEYLTLGLKDLDYIEVYDALRAERAYTVLLPDGAMLQFNYQFLDDELEKHRLAFWPSPHLEQFQNDPDIYLEDSVFAEIVSRRVVPFPIRFDHNLHAPLIEQVRHPVSHLTLGQYENCRIPLSAPLPPAHFVDFILRNFYSSAFSDYAGSLPHFSNSFNDCISENELGLIHLKIPRAIYRPQNTNPSSGTNAST
jgi:hypothetical protein